jgi:hypothetical protein
MIGTEDIFNVIVDSQGVVPKPFIPSPERGLVNLSREHPKIISPKVPYSPTGADLGALFFPCLGIGFAAWWGLLPDQVIMSSPSLSLLDPSCLLPLKEGILEGSSSGVVTEQAFDPKVSPEVGDELKVALTQLPIAIEAPYAWFKKGFQYDILSRRLRNQKVFSRCYLNGYLSSY